MALYDYDILRRLLLGIPSLSLEVAHYQYALAIGLERRKHHANLTTDGLHGAVFLGGNSLSVIFCEGPRPGASTCADRETRAHRGSSANRRGSSRHRRSRDADSSSPSERVVLKEGTEVPLVFSADLNSKTAVDDDTVNMTLADDLKVGDVVVVRKGAPAVATVTNAHKAGMMGKPGELSIRLEYVKSDDQRLRLRGNKGKEGEGKVGATVALTVLFGPIGLIKHGKNVDIPEGTPLTAFVDQDYTLAPAK